MVSFFPGGTFYIIDMRWFLWLLFIYFVKRRNPPPGPQIRLLALFPSLPPLPSPPQRRILSKQKRSSVISSWAIASFTGLQVWPRPVMDCFSLFPPWRILIVNRHRQRKTPRKLQPFRRGAGHTWGGTIAYFAGSLQNERRGFGKDVRLVGWHITEAKHVDVYQKLSMILPVVRD